jgi:hypothetical protein
MNKYSLKQAVFFCAGSVQDSSAEDFTVLA